MVIKNTRLCQYDGCGKMIGSERRPQAKFCKNSCRTAHHASLRSEKRATSRRVSCLNPRCVPPTVCQTSRAGARTCSDKCRQQLNRYLWDYRKQVTLKLVREALWGRKKVPQWHLIRDPIGEGGIWLVIGRDVPPWYSWQGPESDLEDGWRFPKRVLGHRTLSPKRAELYPEGDSTNATVRVKPKP